MKHKKTLISLIVALASTTCQVALLNSMDNTIDNNKEKEKKVNFALFKNNNTTQLQLNDNNFDEFGVEDFTNNNRSYYNQNDDIWKNDDLNFNSSSNKDDNQNPFNLDDFTHDESLNINNGNNLINKAISSTIKKRLSNGADYACKHCGKADFSKKRYLNEHEKRCLKNENRQEYTFQCQYCKKGFTYKSNLNAHETICSENKNREEYKCQYCQKELSTKSYLNEHEKSCRKNKNRQEYKCQYCQKSGFANKRSLTQHEKHNCRQAIKESRTNNQVSCNNNNFAKLFKNNNDDDNEINNNFISTQSHSSNDDDFITDHELLRINNNDENDERFCFEDNFDPEQWINKDGNGSETLNTMTFDQIFNNLENNNNENLKEGTEDFSQKTSNNDLNNQSLNIDNNNTVIKDEIKKMLNKKNQNNTRITKNKKSKYTCKYCEKPGFLNEINLTQHEKDCSKNSNRKEHKCQYCQKKFSRQSTLTEHAKICLKNDNRQEYECQYCQKKGFSNKSNLNTHEKGCWHNESRQEYKFQCQYCAKEFLTERYVTIHEQSCSTK